ncbi:MAG TPA: hypothetical protein VMM56_08130 [Planctomycetaceae bacterium]|nr:hypothetical protein [Planctomycetaceae bacterium]
MPIWLQRYLGIPDTTRGEGTAWRILWEAPWPSWIPDWLGGVVAILIGVGLIGILRRDSRNHSRKKQILLIALRCVAYGLVLFALFQPVLSVNRTVKPIIVILADTSESMSLSDEYDSREETRMKETLAALGISEFTRSNLAKSLLLKENASFLKELLASYKIRVYAFDEEIRQIGQADSSTGKDWDQLLSAIEGLPANGEQTLPGPSVMSLLEQMKGTPPAALILLSDGIATGDERGKTGNLSEAVSALRNQRASLWPAGIGTARATKDVELSDVQRPETAFLGDPVVFECFLTTIGFEQQTTQIRVILERSEEVLISETITLPEKPGTAPYRLEWQPDRTGELGLRIEVVPVTGESDLDNNALIRSVYVRDQPLKTLLVESAPRYEYRYLKEFLERESGVELHTVLFEGDVRQALQDRSGQALAGRFPIRREQILSYDTIVIGDVNPEDLGPGALGLLREYVEKEGKSLILIAGPRYNPQAYGATPLGDLLPVILDREEFLWPRRWTSEGFHPHPTIAGLQGTPAFQWGISGPELSQLWENLPPWYRMYPWPRLKSGAISWLSVSFPHETERPDLPLIAEQRFGSGKVLFHASDELWRLRFLVGDRYYGKYWLQTFRYLTRTPSNERGIELTTDRRMYRQGEPVNVRLRIPRPQETTQARVTITGTRSFEQQLAPSPDHPELFLGALESLPLGNYRVEYLLPGDAVRVSREFRINSARREMTDRNLNRKELEQAAKDSGGQYFSIAEAEQIPRLLPPGQKILLESLNPLPLWNRWELFVLILTLLTVEWILRKRMQLL